MSKDGYYRVVRGRDPATQPWWRAAGEEFAAAQGTETMGTGAGAVLAALLDDRPVVVSADILREFQAWVRARPPALRRGLGDARPYVAEAVPNPEPPPTAAEPPPRGGKLTPANRGPSMRNRGGARRATS